MKDTIQILKDIWKDRLLLFHYLLRIFKESIQVLALRDFLGYCTAVAHKIIVSRVSNFNMDLKVPM